MTARPILYGPELGVYLRVVHDLDPQTALFVLTETVTGLRWGEIAGLHVSGLDPVGGLIHVTQTYAYLLNETTGRKRWQLRPYPKGKKQREVPICHQLAMLLARHADGKRPNQPLFQRSGGRCIDYANQRNTLLQPALELARQRGLAKHIRTRSRVTKLRFAPAPAGNLIHPVRRRRCASASCSTPATAGAPRR
ncbi:hypothetical protein [Nonomuraea coxensis]|uniref:hypothetical protein n=1 Tax=Nonomuraea coxensis TaxID=404386 RepID=UPI0012F99666|nr:hypothetical protein [Nonomuraea coxensis]